VSTSNEIVLVLTRRAHPGHEADFERAIHAVNQYAQDFPGHHGVTIVQPQQDSSSPYTILARLNDQQAADAWMADPHRARLIAQADRYADDGLHVHTLSGLEGWVRQPGKPVMVPPPQWKVALATLAGVVPVLEIVLFLGGQYLKPLPVVAQPIVLSILLTPIMSYAVMPVVTRLLRGFLYPKPHARDVEARL